MANPPDNFANKSYFSQPVQPSHSTGSQPHNPSAPSFDETTPPPNDQYSHTMEHTQVNMKHTSPTYMPDQPENHYNYSQQSQPTTANFGGSPYLVHEYHHPAPSSVQGKVKYFELSLKTQVTWAYIGSSLASISGIVGMVAATNIIALIMGITLTVLGFYALYITFKTHSSDKTNGANFTTIWNAKFKKEFGPVLIYLTKRIIEALTINYFQKNKNK